MLLEVAVQIGLLPEATVAQVALEGFLLVVDVADVALEIGGDAEGAVAEFAPAGAEMRGAAGGEESCAT